MGKNRVTGLRAGEPDTQLATDGSRRQSLQMSTTGNRDSMASAAANVLDARLRVSRMMGVAEGKSFDGV